MKGKEKKKEKREKVKQFQACEAPGLKTKQSSRGTA